MQLLKITTKPIEYTMEVENASLRPAEPTDPQAQHTPGLTEQQQVQQVRTDDVSFQSVGSQHTAPPPDVQAYHPNGIRNTRTVGNPQSAAKSTATLDSTMAQIPRGSVDRSWEPPKMRSVKAQMVDTPSLEDAVKEPNLEYTPGDVDITVEELAKVEIEYLGGPTYFPKSADPEYEEPDA